ncbi:MAG: glutathione-disulfide reductase [Alphaproteobacteria bacterium]
MSTYDVDLFVIGAGSGGVRAARIAAGYGKKVAIAESKFYGGTCVNVGCVPKKLMTYVAGYESAMHDAAGYGWTVGDRSLDWQHFITQKNNEIERLNGIYQRMLDNNGVDIHWGHATITDPHTVRVNDQDISAERILIATGGKVFIPNIEGAREYGITSDDIFYLKEQPKRLVVAGVGYIGLEFAGIFNQLGTKVDVIYRRDKILNEGFDGDVRTFLNNEMEKKGINFHPKTNILRVEKRTDNIFNVHLDNGSIIEADQVLFATGRTPNTDNLGLDTLNIETNKKGAITVNREEQTSVPSIYAVGDVTDRVALTPVALAEGHALVNRLYNNDDRYVSYENIPSAVFSNPNVSQVGLTQEQAQEKFGDDIDIYKSEFRAMKMILANNEERTLMKLVVQRSTDKVIGLHLVGESAGEIVQGFATAIIAGATKSDFDRTIGIHPTSAEEFVTMRTKSNE